MHHALLHFNEDKDTHNTPLSWTWEAVLPGTTVACSLKYFSIPLAGYLHGDELDQKQF